MLFDIFMDFSKFLTNYGQTLVTVSGMNIKMNSALDSKSGSPLERGVESNSLDNFF